MAKEWLLLNIVKDSLGLSMATQTVQFCVKEKIERQHEFIYGSQAETEVKETACYPSQPATKWEII